MLVTRKNNVFSFFLGKPHTANIANARSVAKAQNLKDTKFDQLDKRISITKNEDFYKAQPFDIISPFSQLNR